MLLSKCIISNPNSTEMSLLINYLPKLISHSLIFQPSIIQDGHEAQTFDSV